MFMKQEMLLLVYTWQELLTVHYSTVDTIKQQWLFFGNIFSNKNDVWVLTDSCCAV